VDPSIRFSEVKPALLDILWSMLEYNPYFRPTAKELLKNKLFDGVRIDQNEQVPGKLINISLDK
jgi:hypothetical protein